MFQGWTSDLPTQLWVAPRHLEAISLLLAPLFLLRKMKTAYVFIGYTLASCLILLSIFWWKIFPTCWVEGSGLTPFKIASEYIICAILLAAAFLLYQKREMFDKSVFRLIVASIFMTIASEISFTLFVDLFGFFNQLGHFFMIISFYLIYRATIQIGLQKPYSLLFRNLKRSEEELERANVELAGYAHTVSHDLKGPLTAIEIASDALVSLAKEPQTEEIRRKSEKLAENITISVNRSSELIEDVLNLAEAGQTPKDVSRVDVSETMARLLEERARDIEKKGIQVKVDNDLGYVTASPTHIYEVFTNLISNAIKYNDSKKPVIEISYLGDVERDAHRYLVRDNGSGIPPESLDNIFVPFFKEATGGTGLGLSIVEKIIKLYDGEINAYNDNGACFEFVLRDFKE